MKPLFLIPLTLATAFALLMGMPLNSIAQTQSEMNEEAASDFEAADKELNAVYRQLMGKLDKESQAKLKATQKAWIIYRDAAADFSADLEARGGSMFPLAYHTQRAAITKQRTEELQTVLTDYAE
jgi:uncharacterized protein YecT (DUF1311 family)